MNTRYFFLIGLCAGLLGFFSTASRADDIDIYTGLGAGGGNTPNLMFVLDSSANANASMGACAYDATAMGDGLGGAPSNGSSTLGNEQCALVNIVQFLPTRTVVNPSTGVSSQAALINLGFTTSSGFSFPLTPIDNNSYSGPATITNVDGTITIPAGSTNRQAFIYAAKAVIVHTGGVDQGNMMQETWAYYTGGVGTYSGINTGIGTITNKLFSGTNATSGCQKNYAVFLGAIANSSHMNDAPGFGIADLVAAVTQYENNQVAAGAITTAQANAAITKLTTVITNGVVPDQYVPPAKASGVPDSFAREWARFMYNADVNNNSNASGTQSIVTYSLAVGVNNVDAANFIADMANVGGGKYFSATSYSDIYNDILKILNEVQAVNSVFSSASLPVSVNAQGTFLNQIFMGMFRPDAAAGPRWLGNLKQYEFIIDPVTKGLQLGDSLGNPGLSSSGTGFISPNAISFWSCTDLTTSPYPDPYLTATPAALTSAQIAKLNSQMQNCSDPAGGFWVNDPASANAIAQGFDLPDGERVERGGAAQQIRRTNLTDNYTTSPASPRRLYTYCPSGSSCVANLTASVNAFATSNANITSGMFGTTLVSNISSISRFGSTVTVTTAGNHNFNTGDYITIANVTPNNYVGTFPITYQDATHFNYVIVATPPTPATGSYNVQLPGAGANIASNGIVRSGNTVTVTTSTPHGLPNLTGLSVVITGASPTAYNGTFAYTWLDTTHFTYTLAEQPPTVAGGLTATSATATGNTNAACKTANSVTVNINAWNNATPGVTRTLGSSTATVNTASSVSGWRTSCGVTISGVVDSGGNTVTAYNSPVTIGTLGTNSFTITGITPNPASPGTGGTASLATNQLTITDLRYTDNVTPAYTATVTATTPSATGYYVGELVSIGGTGPLSENNYTGSVTVTAVNNSTAPFTFSYVINTTPGPGTALAGATPTATRSSGYLPSDMVNLINWVRGQDNMGDEKGPGSPVTVRPSVHGDVLHSRPTVINYGDTRGVVVFYGDNGGVFHAVNGNQTVTANGVRPGDELWGFLPSEFYTKLSRLRSNSPQLDMPSTPPGISPPPRPKDYFVDGITGLYQTIDGNGNTTKAILYLSMRRGGRFIYALDVTNPATPTVLWKVDKTGLTNSSGFTASTAYSELGQTWSQPKVAMVHGHVNPVLIFGGGYAPDEDSEPPVAADTMGRAIYVLDAFSGAVVWTASPGGATSCSGNSTQAACVVAGMNYAIPSDITLVDRDNDGAIDRLYAADTGGNIWRVDLEPAGNNTPNYWRVYQLASLGCWGSPCPSVSNPTQRKFFYPPEVIPATAKYPWDSVIDGSGDREHPLYVSTSSQRYNRLFLIKDTYTGNDATGMTPVYASALYDATNSTGCTNLTNASVPGYLITLAAGEKTVSAPLTVAGFVYLSTNTPAAPSASSCTSNLGVAKGYQLSPFSCTVRSVIFDGGGLPPSAVAGVVNITNADGTTTQVPFMIGGANPDCVGVGCKSPLSPIQPPINVSTKRTRTYWYLEGK